MISTRNNVTIDIFFHLMIPKYIWISLLQRNNEIQYNKCEGTMNNQFTYLRLIIKLTKKQGHAIMMLWTNKNIITLK